MMEASPWISLLEVVMVRAVRWWVALLLVAPATPAWGHFPMLLPEHWATTRGKSASVRYLWGHPFEHELADAARPVQLVVLSPDGKPTDLTEALEKTTVKVPGKADVTAYAFRFTPSRRGDHVFVVTAAPHLESEGVLLRDRARVTLHVQTQNGWDNALGKGLEMVPLTRPYGLQPGVAFQAQALADGKPLGGARVEIERYNPRPPAKVPDDVFVTMRVRADPNGVVTCTLSEPGWWCVTVERDGGPADHDGRKVAVKERCALWVYVDEKP
jgi:cobalt/nickel transport protein